MSRIAIIDTAIDPGYIGGKPVEHINLFNLCEGNKYDISPEISHGTLCAMVLDACTSEFELVNIQIFKDNKAKVFGEITLLAEALKMCRELKVDVVSLSAVSSILSDSKYLYDITHDLSKDTVIVSALDNRRFITIPTCYPHVLGVRSDATGLLSPGEMAYRVDDPFGANIYANCDFAFLRELHHGPSNSLAVPVVAGHVNNLLNKGQEISEIESHFKNLRPYPIHEHEQYLPVSQIKKESPVVFLADDTTEKCGKIMDSLYEKYEVQCTALSLVDGPYDVRIKNVKDIEIIKKELCFMEHHYKTDMNFIVGSENQSEEIRKAIEVDVELIIRNERTLIRHENRQESEPNSMFLGRLYEILTT